MKFNVGDRVRYKSIPQNITSWWGQEGIIVETAECDGEGTSGFNCVKVSGFNLSWFELEEDTSHFWWRLELIYSAPQLNQYSELFL